MTEPRNLSLIRAGQMIRNGDLTSEALVGSCLERINAREGEVHAWANLYAQQALETARVRDKEGAENNWRGPLHGLPLGVKDIFDVAGMETRAGSEAYAARTAEKDAESVARLRDSGAIFLGKTVTTAFALGDAGATCRRISAAKILPSPSQNKIGTRK